MPTTEQCREILNEVFRDPSCKEMSRGERTREAARRAGLSRSRFYEVAKVERRWAFYECKYCGEKRRQADCYTIRRGYCENCKAMHSSEMRENRSWANAVAKAEMAARHVARRHNASDWNKWARRRAVNINHQQDHRLSCKRNQIDRSIETWEDAMSIAILNLSSRKRDHLLCPWKRKFRNWCRTDRKRYGRKASRGVSESVA